MNKIRSHLTSGDFRSGGVAHMRLAVAKTNFEAASRCRNRGKTIGADLNQIPRSLLLLTNPQARRRCLMLQSP